MFQGVNERDGARMPYKIPPLDMTVRELLDVLETVPESHRDLVVNILVSLDDGENHIPAIITEFDQFPATTTQPQPTPAF